MKINKLLLLLIIVSVFKQLAWISFIPLWQFPDEQAHFGQVAYTAELGKRELGNDLSYEIYLSEVILQTNRDWAGNNRFTYHPEYNIPYTDSHFGRHENEIINFDLNNRKEMVKVESTFYPPTYYFFPTVVYKLFYSSTLFTRVFLTRLLNILITILITYFIYKIFNLIFKKQLISLIGTILVIFQPMFSFVQAGVNSDNLFNLLFIVGIYLSVLAIDRGVSFKKIILAILIFILMLYTKPQAYLILPVYIFPVIYWILKNKSLKYSLLLLTFLGVFISYLIYKTSKGVLVIPDIGLTSLNIGLDSFNQHLKFTLKNTYREVMPWYWGVFRWLSLALPRWLNRIINYFTLFSLVGLILYFAKLVRRRNINKHFIFILFFIWSIVIYFLIITIWNYLFTISHGFSFGIQGRYYFPLIVPITGIIIYGLLGWGINNKIKNIILISSGIGIIIVHEIGFFTVVNSYYEFSNLSQFFIQASQYKPIFFKSPILQYILLVKIVLIVYLLKYILSFKNNNE